MNSFRPTYVSVVDRGSTPGSARYAGHRAPGDRSGRVLRAHDLPVEVGRRDVAQRLQHLQLLVANAVRLERDRRLHRRQAQNLQQVVLHHVAQAAGLFEVAAAPLDADGLGPGDLDVVDEVVVPDRLEDAVREAEHQQVLDGLFSEVVVDAIDLLLVQDLVDLAVERARRLQVDAERLFDDDARERPPRHGARGQLGLPQAADDGRERRGRRRQIEHPVARQPQRVIDLVQTHLQPLERGRIVVRPLLVKDVAREGAPHRRVQRPAARELLAPPPHLVAERVLFQGVPAEAQHGEPRGQQAIARQAVQRRKQLAARQIARRAEDDHDGRLGDALLDQSLAQRVGQRRGGSGVHRLLAGREARGQRLDQAAKATFDVGAQVARATRAACAAAGPEDRPAPARSAASRSV